MRATRSTVGPGLVLLFAITGAALPAGQPPYFVQPDPALLPDLFVWTDTCSVYVLRDGDAAILIDLGDASVLDHLNDIGVRRVEWVLFTHHHREQCQGAPRLKTWNARVAGPAAERALFEHPTDFRKMKVSLSDAFTIHGSSYVRPPIEPIKLDRVFEKRDSFAWRGREFECTETRGNSPGSMSYVLKCGDRRVAFTGDLMLAGAKMHTWFDTEWDYGFAAGIYALHNSAGWLAGYDPAWLLPSHGPPVRAPKRELLRYMAKLRAFEALYLRGYGVNTFAGGYQDTVSHPTAVSNVWQVLPHVFKFRGPDFWPNFGLILADTGHALVVDCGLLDEAYLDTALEGMRARLGLRQIDAVVITHMHGDHFLEAPHLREKWGAQIWALDRMADVCEHPEWFDYAAPIQAYGKPGVAGVHLDRTFRAGERFDWDGHHFTVDWMPGQTEFALCLHGVIDGRKVAFTGDNLFGDPDDPTQTGHEAMVAHNSAILEEGYIRGAEFLHRLKPDLLLGGHSYVMDRPARFIERYRQWSHAMRDAFRSLSPDADYRYGFDPFWVRAEPYRVTLPPGGEVTLHLHVRNFRSRPQQHHLEMHVPPGLTAEPPILDGSLAGGARGSFPVLLHAPPHTPPGVRVVGFDVTLDGHRYGEWFDAIVEVGAPNP